MFALHLNFQKVTPCKSPPTGVRDHGDWRAIVADRVVDSAKGPKVYYHEFYTRENPGECFLRDGYPARHA